jgi:hypothetical protein
MTQAEIDRVLEGPKRKNRSGEDAPLLWSVLFALRRVVAA